MSIGNKVRLFAAVVLAAAVALTLLSKEEPAPVEPEPAPVEPTPVVEEPAPVEPEPAPVEPTPVVEEPAPASGSWDDACGNLDMLLAPAYKRLNVAYSKREHAGIETFCVGGNGDPDQYVRSLLFQNQRKDDCIEPETLLHELLRGLQSQGLPLNRRVQARVYCGPRYTDDLHVDVVLRHWHSEVYDPATDTF